MERSFASTCPPAHLDDCAARRSSHRAIFLVAIHSLSAVGYRPALMPDQKIQAGGALSRSQRQILPDRFQSPIQVAADRDAVGKFFRADKQPQVGDRQKHRSGQRQTSTKPVAKISGDCVIFDTSIE
jgi:hypothetical protein